MVNVLFRTVLSAICLSIAFAAAALPSARADYSINDVSFLLPLPKTLAELKANFINSNTALATGPLISSSNLRLFDWSNVDPNLDMTVRANIDRLAAVSIRFDPCFRDHFSDPCRPQIRLVLQPITFSGTTATADDLGVHLFFDTTRANILSLIQFAANYRQNFLGVNSAKAPLQIQPILAQESVNGNFWQAFRPMIQNILNQSQASRFAIFTVHPDGRSWTFRSFDLNNGHNATPVIIAGIGGASTERIDNQVQGSVFEFETSSGLLSSSLPNTDQTFDYLIDSVRFRSSGQNRLNGLVNTLDRIENPGTHLPGTIDCLSCHSTPSIRENFSKNRLQMTPTISQFISTTLPPGSLLNLFQDNFQSRDFRLFGYRDANPIVGQRVINESAAIVDSISTQQ